jgi:dihydroorotase-like cyclic amidohydrolase
MIRNATVIFLEKAAQTHVLVQDGRIASIDAAPNTTADEVYDRS